MQQHKMKGGIKEGRKDKYKGGERKANCAINSSNSDDDSGAAALAKNNATNSFYNDVLIFHIYNIL